MPMIRRTLLAAAVATTATLSAGAAFAQAKEVKIGYALAVNSHYGAAANAWADVVEKGTNGAYKFKQFPASALGGERELIEGLQLGTVEAAIVSTGALSNFVPNVGVVDIPFLFRDTQHARAVMDGAFGQDLLAQFHGSGNLADHVGQFGPYHQASVIQADGAGQAPARQAIRPHRDLQFLQGQINRAAGFEVIP